MKKIFSILFLLIIISGGVKAQEITKDFLVRHKFYWGIPTEAYTDIKFTKDNTYKLSIFQVDVFYYKEEGTYMISNNKAYLNPLKCTDLLHHISDSDMYCNKSFKKAECYISNDTISIYYTKLLVLKPKNKWFPDSISIDIDGFVVKEGEKRIRNGIKIITLGLKKGVTTDNVKVREKPSTQSKEIEYIEEPFGVDSKKFVPVNTNLTIIARTENKEQVGNWNNYWYLVNVGSNQEAWMYGEFVKILN